jgi:hypothetical protein
VVIRHTERAVALPTGFTEFAEFAEGKKAGAPGGGGYRLAAGSVQGTAGAGRPPLWTPTGQINPQASDLS